MVLSKLAVDATTDSVERLKQAIDALPEEVVGADGASREPNRVKALLQALLPAAGTKAGVIGENFRRTVSGLQLGGAVVADTWSQRIYEGAERAAPAVSAGIDDTWLKPVPSP